MIFGWLFKEKVDSSTKNNISQVHFRGNDGDARIPLKLWEEGKLNGKLG